jgi:beta-carotene hydroxylase
MPDPAAPLNEAAAAQIAMREAASPAWGTVALFLANTALWAISLIAAVEHLWPLWLSFVVSTITIYVNYTPLHEAVHGNIAAGNRNLIWLNEIIGTISGILFFHGFALHRVTHLAHHANTNDAKRDPDHWAHGPLSLALVARCLTILLPHERHGWRLSAAAANGRPTMLRGIAERVVTYGGFAALILTGHTDAAIFAVGLPAILASGALAFLFDWLVHHPHTAHVSDRYRATNAFLFARGHRTITALYFWQNYHLIHHLFPRVPFYRYGKVFDQIRELLEARNANIKLVGKAG